MISGQRIALPRTNLRLLRSLHLTYGDAHRTQTNKEQEKTKPTNQQTTPRPHDSLFRAKKTNTWEKMTLAGLLARRRKERLQAKRETGEYRRRSYSAFSLDSLREGEGRRRLLRLSPFLPMNSFSILSQCYVSALAAGLFLLGRLGKGFALPLSACCHFCPFPRIPSPFLSPPSPPKLKAHCQKLPECHGMDPPSQVVMFCSIFFYLKEEGDLREGTVI